jgi:outer membrane protein assembly factor BamB
MPKGCELKRYYSGVLAARTTRCCSAVALSVGLVAAAAAAPEHRPLALFPLTKVWTVSLDPALAAPPAFDEAQAYLPLADGHVAALGLADGMRSWTHDATAVQAPAAGDRLVFVPTPAAVTALSAADGAVVWQLPMDKIDGPLVWKSGWLLVPTADGIIRALRASDGTSVWQADVAGPPHARPTVFGDRIYVPTADGRIVALAVETGRLIWERHLDGAANQVTATDDRVYAGSVDNFFYCLDARDGRIDWRWRTGADVIGAAAIDAERVYFVSLDNVLRALDRHSGVQRWMRPLDMRPASGPIEAASMLTVSGGSPTLDAFDVSDGRPDGTLTAPGDLTAPPYVFTSPPRPTPLLFVATGNIAGGTTVTVYTRAIEPPVVPVAPLPNLTRIGSGAATEPPAQTAPSRPRERRRDGLDRR